MRKISVIGISVIGIVIGMLAAPAAAQSSDPSFKDANDKAETAASQSAQSINDANVADPWEGFNRKMFAANNFFDETILVPTAKAYRAVTPAAGRRGLRRFLGNFATPVTLVNDLLQGEFGRAGDTAGRFIINTTIGFGGIADPAAQMGIEDHSEDFGQTLAVWGVPSGPFLVLPFFGPSSPRDGFGRIIDNATNPLPYFDSNAADIAQYSVTGSTLISAREPLIEPLEDIKRNSLDFYASFRSFYLQARQREIANGITDFNDLPDIGDFEDFEELE